jgi:fructose-1,6-bisphosphatase/inositol monophosphatase family enzyme
VSALPDAAEILGRVRLIQAEIRDRVVAACEEQSIDALSAADDSHAGDTIFAVDRISEDLLLSLVAEHLAGRWPLVLIAEGLHDSGLGAGIVTLPAGLDPGDAVIRVICDPIDGTRGLMYQKRSAWILTAVAPNRGPGTSLSDVALAVQTEIPLVKQTLSDVVWAVRGEGIRSERYDRRSGESAALTLRPSTSTTLRYGFAQISRFVPGGRAELAAIDDEIMAELLGPVQAGKAMVFEDQYICTGGQLYELVAGHDRFSADIRPLLDELLARDGEQLGLCVHPYDICTVLIAQEAGVVVTDGRGRPFDARLDVTGACDWVGYASEALRATVEPALHNALRRRGLL